MYRIAQIIHYIILGLATVILQVYLVEAWNESCLSDSGLVEAMIPIEGVEFEGPLLVNNSDEVNFTRTVDQGSHVLCMICYGDNSFSAVRPELDPTPWEVSYTYYKDGDFATILTCMNILGFASVTLNVTVQTPIMDYTYWSDWEVVLLDDTPLVFHNNISNGTDVTVEVTYCGTPVMNVTWDGRSLSWTMEASEHGVGSCEINVTLYNLVSRVEDISMITADYRILGLNASMPHYVAFNVPVNLTIEAASGSSVTKFVDWGEVSNVGLTISEVIMENKENEPWVTTMSHTYTTIGAHHVWLIVSNTHDNSFAFDFVVIVEHAVLDGDMEFYDIAADKDNYEYAIRQLSEIGPTNAIVELWIDDGTNLTEPFTTEIGGDQLFNHVLEDLRGYDVIGHIFNNVSSIYIHHTLLPQIPFVDLEINISDPQPLASPHSITIDFTSGFNGDLSVSFGDGTPIQNFVIKSIDELPEINYTYAAVGTYFVSINVTNMYFFGTFEHLADVDTVITNCSLVYEHEYLSLGPLDSEQPSASQSYTFVASSGSRITTFFYDNIYAYYQTIHDAPFNFDPIEIPYYETEVYNTTSCCYNSLSSSCDEHHIRVQWMILDPIVAPVYDCVLHFEEPFLLQTNMTLGTMVHVDVDYGEGTNTSEYFKYGLPNGTAILTPYYFVEPGFHNVTATVQNDINSTDFSITACSQIRVAGLRGSVASSVVLPRSDPVRVEFSWDKGTHEEVTAEFDNHNMSDYLNISDKAGTLDIPSDYLYVGTARLTITVRNLVSFEFVKLTTDMDFLIEGFSIEVVPPYIAFGEDAQIQADVTNGTRLTYRLTIEFSDQLISFLNYQHINTIHNAIFDVRSVSYAGYFPVMVKVWNSVSLLNATALLGVEHEIIESNFKFNHSEQLLRPKYPASFELQLINGPVPTGLEACYDYNDSFVECIPHSFSDVLHVHDYNFTDYGDFYLTLNVSNNISYFILKPWVRVGVAIGGLNFTADKYIAKVDVETVSFMLHVDKGSLVVYSVDLGNGMVLPPLNRNDNGWQNPDSIIVEFTYNSSGVFTPIVVAENVFGVETLPLFQNLILQHRITGTEMPNLPPHAIPSGIVNFIIILHNDTHAPTNASCTFNHGDDQGTILTSMEFIENSFSYTYTYKEGVTKPGTYTVLVNCSNLVSTSSYEMDIILQEPIDIDIDCTTRFIIYRTAVTMDFAILKGSHAHIRVNFDYEADDVEADEWNYPNGGLVHFWTVVQTRYELMPRRDQYFTYLFEDPGDYSFEASVVNDVSGQVKLCTNKFGIQIPVPPLSLSNPSYVDYAKPAWISVALHLTYVDQETNNVEYLDHPTNVRCVWSPNNHDIYHLLEPVTFPVNYTFQYSFSDVAIQIPEGYINCSNMVSSRFQFFRKITVEEKIENCTLSFNYRSLRTTMDELETYVNVQKGTGVATIFNFMGDPTKERPSGTVFPKNDKIKYKRGVFDEPKNFTVKVTVKNNVSSLDCTPFEKKMVVQNDVLPILVKNVIVAPIPPGIVNFSVEVDPTQQRNEPGTDPFVSIHCDEASNNASYAPSLGQKYFQPHLMSLTFSDIGPQTCNVTCFNLRSSHWTITETFLQEVIKDLQIIIHTPDFIKVNEKIDMDLMLGNGSHVIYTVLYSKVGRNEDDVIPHPQPYNSTETLSVDHLFIFSGNYTITVTAANNVSNVSVTTEHRQGVQDVLTGLDIATLDFIPVPLKKALYNMSLPKGAPIQSAVHFTFDYGDEQPLEYFFTSVFYYRGNFPVEHEYNETMTGNITTHIIAWNMVSELDIYVTNHVIRIIEGLEINVTQFIYQVNDKVNVCMEVEHGTEMLFTVNYGDNVTERVAPGMKAFCFVHVYTKAGNYSISASARNKANTIYAHLGRNMTIQDPIIEENLKIVYPKGAYFGIPPGNVMMVLAVIKGNIPSNVHIMIDYGDGNKGYSYAGMFPHEIHFKYAPGQKGTKNVTLQLLNDISKGNLSTEVYIVEHIKIDGIYFDEFIETFTFLNLTIRFITGTFMSCRVLFGDGELTWLHNIPTSQYTFPYRYYFPGNYSVEATCVNNVSMVNKVAGKPVQVQNAIKKVSVRPLTACAAIGEETAFLVELQEGAPFPTGASLNLSFGDDERQIKKWIIPTSGLFKHKYKNAGVYPLDLLAENEVSSEVSSAEFLVQVKIDGIRMVSRLKGDSKIENIFSTTSDVELEARYNKGTEVNFAWLIGKKKFSGQTISYSFNRTQTVFLNASNCVSFVLLNQTIVISSKLRIAKVDYPPSWNVAEDLEFVITVVGATDRLCFAFQLKWRGKEDTLWCARAKDMCAGDDKFSEKKYYDLQSVQDIDYTCVFQFKDEATYDLVIYAFNTEGNVSKAEQFSITRNPCSPAVIEPAAGPQCQKYKRADDVTFFTSNFNIKLRCAASDVHTPAFVFLNESQCDQIEEDVEKTRDVMKGLHYTSGPSIMLKNQTLPYGHHCLLFQISYPIFNVHSHSQFCFLIEPSPLITCLNGKKFEVISYGKRHNVSTQTFGCTEDIDQIAIPFTYHFFCWNIENPPKDMKHIAETQVEVPEGVPQDNLHNSTEGCFGGKGPAKLELDSTTEEFSFNSGWFLPNQTYVFKVFVFKGTRNATAEYTVNVYDGEVWSLGIKCDERNNNCYRNSMKVNRNKPFCLVIWCQSCEPELLPNFDVTVKKADMAIPVPQRVVKRIVNGQAYLYICLDMKSLCAGRHDVDVFTRAEKAIGAATFPMSINKKPWDCTFAITPKEITPLSRVGMRIYNCKDDGESVEADGEDEEGSCKDKEENEDPVKKRRRKRELEEPNESSLRISFYYITAVNGTQKKNPIFNGSPLLPLGDPDDNYRIKVVAVVEDRYKVNRTYSKYVTSKPIQVANVEEAILVKADIEKRINEIVAKDLTTSLDVLGDLADKVTALNMFIDLESLVTIGTSGGARPGSDPQSEGEDDLVQRLAEQALLAKLINSLVALVEGDEALNEALMLAVFRSFASLAKELSPWATLATKGESLGLVRFFLENIGIDHYSDRFISEYTENVGDIFESTLGVITLPKLDIHKIAPENEDRTDIALRTKENEEVQEDLMRQSAGILLESADKIVGVAQRGMLLDESLFLGDGDFSVTVALSSAENANGKMLSTGGSEVEFPGNLFGNDSSLFGVFYSVIYIRHNIFAWHESSIEVTNGLTIIDMVDQDGLPLEFDELTHPLKIDMHQKEAGNNWANMTAAALDLETNMVYMYVLVDVPSSALIIELDVDDFDTDEDVYFEIYFTFGARNIITDRPNTTIGTYDLKKEMPDVDNPYAWVLIIPERHIQTPGLYLGILPKIRNSPNYSFNQTPEFNVRSSLPRCRTWDMEEEIWTGKSCKVGKESTMDNTRCECDTLTRAVRSYSGGVSLPKVNAIDFAKVFANFSSLLAANPVVLATILTILTLYLLLLFWARRADRADVEKWGVSALLDNPLDCEHFYKISVYTGLRQNAGTHSKSCFILSGYNCDTGVRVLDDGHNKHFNRGTVRHFIMASEMDLGELNYLRVWHDNSGEGIKASWFLDKVVIDDLQARIRYFFLNGKWLAVDEDDGQIDRMLPPAGQEEIDGFNHVFFSTARQNLTDEHLWISVLSRPTRSYFTRAQRLTSCLLLLCTTMLANAMWYGSAENVERDRVLKIGPLVLSLSTILVSVYSSLTVVPINVLVVQLFRKSKPRYMVELDDGTQMLTTEGLAAKKKTSRRVTKLLQYKSDDPFAPMAKGGKGNGNFETISEAEMVIEDMEGELEGRKVGSKEGKRVGASSQEDEGKKKKKKKKKRKYWFPWWGVPVAWILSFIAISISLFIVLLYSLEWGRLKSEEWMSALFLAFVQSVFIIQPIKIVVIALTLSIIFRKHQDDEDDENDPNNAQAAADEIFDDQDEVENIERRMKLNIPSAPSRAKLEEARRERQYEKKMWSIIKEVVTYLFFLILVAFIAWGAKDDTRSRHTRHIKNLMEGHYNWSKVAKARTWDKFWFYIEDTVVDSMYNVRDYSGSLTKRGDRTFMNDMVNVRVGFMRLRQVRVKPARCDIPELLGNLIMECNTEYDIFDEENKNFTYGWLATGENYTEPNDEVEAAFRYKDVFEMKGVPIWGRVATYGGGGYVAELGASPKKSRRLLNHLKEVFWLDYYTRAIFLEYTVYNVNKNLFAHVTYMFEFPAFGGVLPKPMVRSFQVYHVLGGMGTVVLVAEALYLVVLIFFIIREIRKVRKQTWKEYIKDPWNIYEVVVIVTSLVGIAMFSSLEVFGRYVTKQLHKDKDAYAQYLQLATYEEALSIVIGVIVFLTNIRFLRLLRFNRAVVDLFTTARMAIRDILYFSISFLIMFIAFALSGVLLFGRTVYLYSDAFRSFSGTFSIMMGKMRWHELVLASPTLAGIYFCTFLIVMFFTLVHMFVSILTVAYDTARKGEPLGEAQNNVFEFLGEKIGGFFGFTKSKRETGADYKDTLDSLDDRLDYINNLVNSYYREDMRKAKYTKNAEESLDPKDSKAAGFMRTDFSWTDMFTF